jgi:Plasmid pRiA4b ORF-3-like protein
MSSTDQRVQVYQLRIWIRHISPQIWRRLLVRSDSTIAQLHDTLQIAFGWTDEHLHQFVIRGKPYGIGRSGGMSFDDNPHQVQLRDFHFRWKETWVYEYDLTDWWQHEIRLELVLPFDPAKQYPICLAGKRRGPIVIWRKICQEQEGMIGKTCHTFQRGLRPDSPTLTTRSHPHRLSGHARDLRAYASTAPSTPIATPTAVDQSA